MLPISEVLMKFTPLRPRCLPVVSVFLLFFTACLAHAQGYTRVVIFGDSLSDTGNLAHVTNQMFGVRVPGPAFNYTDGRATDGADTLPAAQKYFGLWIEQFAALLPSRPILTNSLDGGTNYAYGFATTANSISVVNLAPSFAVPVHNLGQQITDYLATSPVIDDRTLFIVWAGANDILGANSIADVARAATNLTNDIQRLIRAGGTQFLIPNQPPLGLVPEINGNFQARITANAASLLFNGFLSAGVALLEAENRGSHVNLMQLDVFALFYKILAAPVAYGLRNVRDASQGDRTIDPDTYLFWDELHPTTKGHNILALAASALVSARGK
jgi:outer membrane lipase/esterase